MLTEHFALRSHWTPSQLVEAENSVDPATVAPSTTLLLLFPTLTMPKFTSYES